MERPPNASKILQTPVQDRITRDLKRKFASFHADVTPYKADDDTDAFDSNQGDILPDDIFGFNLKRSRTDDVSNNGCDDSNKEEQENQIKESVLVFDVQPCLPVKQQTPFPQQQQQQLHHSSIFSPSNDKWLASLSVDGDHNLMEETLPACDHDDF